MRSSSVLVYFLCSLKMIVVAVDRLNFDICTPVIKDINAGCFVSMSI